MKDFFKSNAMGVLLCLGIALPCYFAGLAIPVIGGPIFGILAGMALTLCLKNKTRFKSGISFTSKTILQTAVVLLGFGLDLGIIASTGLQSLPIILSTIATSLVVAYLLNKLLRVPGKTATLIGVGSSICGGSAIAATAPVVNANDEEIAQSISVIFLFNMVAALFFPTLGAFLGFDTATGEAFGIFAGTAVNDTSSVTATAATWDALYGLGNATLDKAVTVKLTRTLAIIPITLALSLWQAHKAKKNGGEAGGDFNLRSAFPMFILFFVLASVVTTIALSLGAPAQVFEPLKLLSKFFIIMAMVAVGLNTNIVKLVKSGGRPIALGFCCWIGIIIVSLTVQNALGIW